MLGRVVSHFANLRYVTRIIMPGSKSYDRKMKALHVPHFISLYLKHYEGFLFPFLHSLSHTLSHTLTHTPRTQHYVQSLSSQAGQQRKGNNSTTWSNNHP
jgi:hypothetical protein